MESEATAPMLHGRSGVIASAYNGHPGVRPDITN